MALIHDVKFETVVDMIMEITDVYLQFSPRDPIPDWWSTFTVWSDSQEVNTVADLRAKLDEIEKLPAKERPDWWKQAEKQFKAADTMRVLTIKTDPFDPEDEEDEDVRASREEPDDDTDPEPDTAEETGEESEEVDTEEVDPDEDETPEDA